MTEQEAFEAKFDAWIAGADTLGIKPAAQWWWNAALEWARTQQEPVAWMSLKKDMTYFGHSNENDTPLYAAPVAPTLPKGWKLVPEEPTRKMLSEIGFQRGHTREHRQLYRALLIAAPEYKDGE